MTMTTESKLETARKNYLSGIKTNKGLVDIYNLVTGGNVKRFASRPAGIARIMRHANEVETVAVKLDKLVATTGAVPVKAADPIGEVLNDDRSKPLPGVGEVLARVAGKEADELETRTVKGTPLVVVNGRTVRPENVSKVKAGVAIWGGLEKPTAKKDKLRGVNQDINLNYPLKDKVAALREGTGRYKLVVAMRKGITIEEVMKMFDMKREAAIYKVRDLHYVGGHGLKTVGGKVFIIEPGDEPKKSKKGGK